MAAGEQSSPRSRAASAPDTTDAIRAFTLAPTEPCPATSGYDSSSGRARTPTDRRQRHHSGRCRTLIELAAGAGTPTRGNKDTGGRT